MSIWQWLIRYRFGDDNQQKLFHLILQGSDMLDTDPDRALALYHQGRELAEHLNDPWMILFFDHWKLQTLIFRKRDYKTALDIATQAAVEARKPVYAQLPQRVCVHEDLIHIYTGIDPDGNLDSINQALAYMDEQITPSVECWLCHLSLYVELATSQEKWEEALKYALRYLSECDNEHHRASAFAHLCEIAFGLQDWENLAVWATEGEASARKNDRPGPLLEFLAWQTVVYQQQGDEKEAHRYHQATLAQANRFEAIPGSAYFKALSVYYELKGDLERALHTRDDQLDVLAGRGQTIVEYYAHRERCRLLKKMSAPFDEALTTAKGVARQLKNSNKYLIDLEQVLAE